MKKLDQYNGIELVKKLIDQHVNQSEGLFDPEYLKGIKFCLKVLSKKGPSGELFSRALKKLNYLERTYNPRKEPGDLGDNKLTDKDFLKSEKDPGYLLNKFGFLDAAESEFKMLCHNSWSSINSVKKTSTNAQQKIKDYKCVIAFLGSTLRTSDDKTDENSCQYEFTNLRKMYSDVLKRKNSYGFHLDSDESNSCDLEKYNLALFRVMGMVLAHENLSPKDASNQVNFDKIKRKLNSKYKKQFSEIRENEKFSNLNNTYVTETILHDFEKLSQQINPTNMTKKIAGLIENLKKPSKTKSAINFIEMILDQSHNSNIKSHKDEIIKKMFPSPKEKFDSTYFDKGEGGRYIGFSM